MKIREYLSILLIVLFATIGYAAPPPMSGGSGAANLTSYTVATLPTPTTGLMVAITDGADATDCTTGSGSTYVMCIYNGTAWVASGTSTTGGDVTAVGSCTGPSCATIGNADTSAGYIDFLEDSDNGTNYVRLIGAASTANVTVTLPAATGTVALLGTDQTFSGANTISGVASFTANPKIYDGDSHYLTLDAKDLTGDATVTIGGDTNNLYINNGTAILDIAAGATANIDTSLTVDTAAVTLKGKSGGSTITLPTALDLDETMTNANLCKYTTTGTKISCDVAIGTDVQAYDAELAAIAGLTFADASVIQLTGAAAAATLTSGGANRALVSNSANDALEFAAITSAMITDNTIVAGDLAATLTFSDGDLINLSGITQSSDTNEGLILPTWANVSVSGITNGAIAWDETSSAIKVKNTSGWVSVGATAAPVDASYVVVGENATLTGERVFTEGLAIDITDAAPVGGTGGTLTVAFDPTELTGDRTWAAGGAATNTWTWNVSTGTDPSLTFGNDNVLVNNTLTATKLVTANAGVTVATGQNVTVGTTQWNSGDEIDGTKIKDADYGDIVIDAAGDWQVQTDSHAHGATTLTLASTDLSDTSALGYLAGANTWTGNNVFGNGDTDTLTIRSMIIGGNSRAVQIAASVASPTYATGTNELYVAGDVEAGGTVYAAAFNGGTGTDGTRGITLVSNSALTPSADQIYFIADKLYYSEAGAQKTPVRIEDTQTITGKKTFQGDIAVGDASNAGTIDIYDGSDHYWTVGSPSISGNLVLTLPSSAGTTGQYLKTTTTGSTAVLSWDTPTASADTTGGTGGVQFNAGGVLTSDAGFVFTTATDKLALGSSGGSTTGTVDLYYTGTTYAATITPNAAMSADVTITLPDNTSTLIGSGANTFTGSQIYSAASNDSTVAVQTFTGVPAQNASDVHRGIYFAPTGSVLGTITGTGNTVAFIDLAAITGDANANLYGMRLGNLTGTTGAAGEVEYGISIGTGWDRGISTASPVYVGDGTNGTTIGATGNTSFAGTATFTTADAASSVPWKVAATTAANTAEGTAYWESDTDMLTIGDGDTGISLDFTAAAVYTFPTATATLAKVDSQVFTTYIEAPYLILGSAATAADAGAIRMPNATYIYAEADAAGDDISVIGVDSSEIIQIGSAGASAVKITPSLSIGPAAPDDVRPTLAVIGDADSDAGGDTTEAFTITLTPAADPTAATWGFTSTQSAGYTFDKLVTFAGDITVTGADLTLGTGIKATGGAGVFTLTDLAGTSEVLAIDLRTENTAKLTTSSGVATLDAGAMNVTTTGFVALGADPADAGSVRLSNAAAIVWEDATELSLTHVDNTGLLLNSTHQLQFGDSGTYINQSGDGVLNVATDTELKFLVNDEDIKLTKTGSNGITIGTNTGTTTITSSIVFNVPVTFDESVEPATDNLTALQLSRGFINNYGQSGAAILTLPAAAEGLTFVAIVGTKYAGDWEFHHNGAETIYTDIGGVLTAGRAGIKCNNQEVGSRMSCATFQTGEGTYSWLCGAISGTWTAVAP